MYPSCYSSEAQAEALASCGRHFALNLFVLDDRGEKAGQGASMLRLIRLMADRKLRTPGRTTADGSFPLP